MVDTTIEQGNFDVKKNVHLVKLDCMFGSFVLFSAFIFVLGFEGGKNDADMAEKYYNYEQNFYIWYMS